MRDSVSKEVGSTPEDDPKPELSSSLRIHGSMYPPALQNFFKLVYELHIQMWACAQSAVPTEAGRSLAAGVSDSMCLTWVVETELGPPEE